VGAAVGVLTRAFIDNPATLAMLPCPERQRRVKLARVMRGFVEAARQAGDASIVRAGGRPGGVMLSFAPGDFPLGVLAYAWLSFGPVAAGPRTALRYALADRHLRRLHPREPHFYLFVLGVEPELQGRGLGGRMLAELCARADRDGLACYLETDKASSVRLYERHGFRVEVDQTEDKLGVRFWTMLREGRAARGPAARR
jgi:ribosomal protein S18 acetylase RimI-like enzyme